ncbi:MAG TPA: two-component regulator propeller domain-containing protein [Blastocatellia bacterium]|nr:two-component regulator propeller domain-containing protein [Blastocatellia bacterium]
MPRTTMFPLFLGIFVALFTSLRVAPSQSSASTQAQTAASSNLHRWGAVTLVHGLPSDHVRAIAQASDGGMWFGTDSGLVKYDGRRIQKAAASGPAASRVLALKLDSQGGLWIGTDAGAARLIDGEIRVIPETGGSTVTAIITPESGRALMTTLQGEIFDCSIAGAGSFKVHTIKPNDHHLLTIESRGHSPVQLTSLALIDRTLIVGTRSRGLLAIDSTQISVTAKKPDFITEILSTPRAFFVQAIEADARGRLWFGAETSSEDSGLYDGRDLMRPEKTGAGTGTVTALGLDTRGNILVGTDARGAFVYRDGRRLDQFTFESTGGGLLSNHVYSIFIDREGVAWFGTDRGVCRYDPGSLWVETVSPDLESNFARALYQSTDGNLWCGTNRGLFVRDKDSSWQEVPEMKSRVIHAIAEDSEGRLLVGTAFGLFVAPNASSGGFSSNTYGGRVFSRVDYATGTTDNIRAIAMFRGATYIANFGRGLERLDGSKRTLVWPDNLTGASENKVVSLHAEDERLWIGTAEAGVFLFDGKQTQIDHALDELAGAGVWSIEGTSDEVLWLATARGLYALRSGKLERVIEDVDARCVVAASAAESAVWCATVGGGLYKVLLDQDYGASSGETVSFLTARIDGEQGLPSQQAFAVAPVHNASGDETLWIATSRGVARYEPGHVAPVLNVTRAMAKRVYTPEELSGGLNLEYPQNSLALEVAAIASRTFPEQFQYSFSVLDGSGRIVREKRSRESQLLIEGLRPGRYRVVARAFTSDLVPSDALQFEFAVASSPFPWTSTTLSVLLVLALMAMWWGYRQNRRLVGTNRQLADTRLQLANETETERRRIARDLHDQTLADLRRLMMLTDQLPANESRNGHVEPSQFRDEIESISTEIRRICEHLSPSALANVGLAAALEWALADAVAHLPPDKKFEYEFACDGGIEERVRLDASAQIQVYRIVQEALSNICRHASATRVRLAVAVDGDGGLLIELEDNGGGFDGNKSGRAGRGLTNIRSRASLIEASVHWRALPEGGTLFTLRKSVGIVVPPSSEGF